MTHDYCPLFHYCRRCGIARTTVGGRLDAYCHATPNVVGVSHLIALRRNQQTFSRMGLRIIGPTSTTHRN